MLRRAFHAMGTEVELLLDAEPSAESEAVFAHAEREFERLEALLSRFRSDSQLSALNRSGVLDAGPDLVAVTRLALEARERTGGLFDPTVHDALVAAGYDRTFDEVLPEGDAQPAKACRGKVRIEGSRIELEPGFRLDLGGIAKGYAVDRALAQLSPGGALPGQCGRRPRRTRPAAGRWASRPPTVSSRSGSRTARSRPRAATAGGGSATGDELHHLIDPATGTSAEGEFLRVTVLAPTAVDAEVLAKAAFLGAPVDTPAVFVTTDGRTLLTGGIG